MTQPKTAAELLKGIMPGIRSLAGLSGFQVALDHALGEERSEHCRVAGYRAGKLFVEVDSAPLFAELSGFQRESLRLELSQRLQPMQIAQIVFRMGGTSHA